MHGKVRTSLGLGLGRSHHHLSSTPTDPKHGPAADAERARRRSFDRAVVEHRRPKSSSPRRVGPANLEFVIESPPLVFYGPAATSTGALLSGQLVVVVHDREMRLTSLSLALRACVTTKKPVQAHCPDCATKVSDLFRLELLKEAHTFKKGRHAFPFSYLLPGHLPATSHGSLGVIDYKLAARAGTSPGPSSSPSSPPEEELRLERPLKVERALMPGNDKTSTRIFPPTSISAQVVLPPVIHPIGEFPVQLRMSGLVRRGVSTQTRWQLRKMNWRIEEHARMVSPACARHGHKLGGEGKGVQHEATRIIGCEDLKAGWKTDHGTGEGAIEMEFQAAVKANTDPVCDVDSENGMAVHHTLVVELVVAEEYCPLANPKLVTPTGAARILRMTFQILITARMGLGISWDEEQPPMYSDVPASPPSYTHMEACELELLDYDEIERLHL